MSYILIRSADDFICKLKFENQGARVPQPPCFTDITDYKRHDYVTDSLTLPFNLSRHPALDFRNITIQNDVQLSTSVVTLKPTADPQHLKETLPDWIPFQPLDGLSLLPRDEYQVLLFWWRWGQVTGKPPGHTQVPFPNNLYLGGATLLGWGVLTLQTFNFCFPSIWN